MFSEKCAFTWNDVLYVFHDSGVDIQLILIIWTNVPFYSGFVGEGRTHSREMVFLGFDGVEE